MTRGFQRGVTSNIKTEKITPSKEDYLKALLELSEHKMKIHSVDIANALGISKASVSRMMNILKEEGYIAKEKYGTVTLMENGWKIASCVRKRHDLLKSFLTDVLGVQTETANGDACRMEHAISFETTEKLNQQLKKLSECVRTDACEEEKI